MQEVRISRSAVLSLVAGMLFYVPFVTGMTAAVSGVYALLSIKRHRGQYLGKGIAIGGLVLGLISTFVWSAVTFTNAVYAVDPREAAVVLRGKIPHRTVGPGLHFLLPGWERVVIVNVTKRRTGVVETQKFLTYDKKFFNMKIEFDWRICLPWEFVEAFPKRSGARLAQRTLANRIVFATRDILMEQQIVDYEKVNTKEFFNAVFEVAEKKAIDYGLCIPDPPWGEEQTIRFLVSED